MSRTRTAPARKPVDDGDLVRAGCGCVGIVRAARTTGTCPTITIKITIPCSEGVKADVLIHCTPGDVEAYTEPQPALADGTQLTLQLEAATGGAS